MSKLTKERIVAAAEAALVNGGYIKLSLRGLARQLDVTAPALYDHFQSKDDLLRSVAEQGFHALIDATDVQGDRAIDRVRARALAYVDFATHNAELFQLMFLYRPAAIELVNDDGSEIDNELNAATEAFDRGVADLGVAIRDGDLVDRDEFEMAMILWVATHGIATVGLTAPTVAAAVADNVIDTVLAGLTPTVTTTD